MLEYNIKSYSVQFNNSHSHSIELTVGDIYGEPKEIVLHVKDRTDHAIYRFKNEEELYTMMQLILDFREGRLNESD
jgi:predicted transcriptional regulator YheO